MAPLSAIACPAVSGFPDDGGTTVIQDVAGPEAVPTPPDAARPNRTKRLVGRFGLLGPAFVAAIAYVDPGNVAANLQAGSRYGYLLVWVLVVAVASAGVVQFLSAKLGLATGMSLPQLVGLRLGRGARLGYWLQAEAVAMATDLAEVVGGAIALYLLFDLPLLLGGVIAGAVSLAVLAVQNKQGQRSFERVITGFLVIIAVGFVAGLFVVPPAVQEVANGLIPRFAGMDSVLLAAAMLGATVMPHAVYLHSALTRDRFGRHEPGVVRRRLLTATRTDVVLAMVLAGSVNIAMLLVAAAGLRGKQGVDTIEGAHAAITSTLGPIVGTLFAVGLLASGLASASVGSYAGSVVMEGLLQRRVPLVARRVITLVPALVLLAIGADPTSVLVVSQVVLSFGLPFVLIPLIRLTSDPAVMAVDANRPAMKVAGWTIIVAIIALNAVLIISVVGGF